MSATASKYARAICKSTPELSRTARAALLALATYADAQGRCWPSAAEVGDVIGVTRPNATRAISELRAAGVIAVRSGGGTRSNTYQFPTRNVLELSTPVPPAAHLDPETCAASSTPPVPPAAHHLCRQQHREGSIEGSIEEGDGLPALVQRAAAMAARARHDAVRDGAEGVA